MIRKEKLISSAQITEKIAEFAKEISEKYKDKSLHVVIIMKGALFFAADFMKQLEIPCTFSTVSCKSYKGMQRGALSCTVFEPETLKDKHLLILDDIFDAGATVSHVYKELVRYMPSSCETAVLLCKKRKRDTNFMPEYALFEIEDHFVIGYGMDYDEKWRNLNEIYKVIT